MRWRRLEQDVLRSAFDAAFEDRFEGLVAGVVLVEGKIVTENDEPRPFLSSGRPHVAQASGQRSDVFAVDLHQLDLVSRLDLLEMARHFGVHGLDQRGFAHASGAPEQGVVGRQALGEAPRVVQQLLARPRYPLEQCQGLTADLGHGNVVFRVGLPDEAFRARKIWSLGGRRSKALQSCCNRIQAGENGGIGGHRCRSRRRNWGRALYRAKRSAGHRRLMWPNRIFVAN
jgi:hypothetical protein